jgi:hypothetical protein
MVGVARRLERGEIENFERLSQAYYELVRDEEFMNATEVRTADEDSVARRMAVATTAFADVS